MLIGAGHPMLSPIPVSWLGLDSRLHRYRAKLLSAPALLVEFETQHKVRLQGATACLAVAVPPHKFR